MPNNGARPQAYVQAREEIRQLLANHPALEAVLAAVVGVLRTTLPHYSWVGIYMVEGDDLVLRVWQGPQATEHVRIPIGHGVCGWAAEKKETVLVTDVSRDARYLMCFPNTKSEIVVPIVKGDRVYGEIDVDGDEPGAFDEVDSRFLEEVAAELAELC